MHVHFEFALLVGFLGDRLQLVGLGLDLFLFFLVTLDFLAVLLLRLAGGQRDRQLGQVLLVALGLIVVPLIGGGRLLDRRLVLVEQRRVLRMATHVAENGTDRGQDGGQYRQAGGEIVAAMLGDVLDFVIVGTVDMKTVTGHCRTPENKKQGRIVAAAQHNTNYPQAMLTSILI